MKQQNDASVYGRCGGEAAWSRGRASRAGLQLVG